MSFQFPDPTVTQEVVNPITGSLYRWVNPPGKWVVASQALEVSDIIWEGETPPDPVGDYKLWYSTDTLELYFYYCDRNNTCAWVPTSAPITLLDDLDEGLFEVKQDLIATNVAVRENENRIGRTIEYGDTAPTIYPEVEVTRDIIGIDGVTVIGTETEYFFNELNFKFWYDTSRLELLVLYKDPDDGAYSYVPVSLPLTNLDLDALNTQVQANSYSNNQQSQAIVVLEDLLVAMQEDLNSLKDLTEPNEDLYSSIAYIPLINDQIIYPLELIDKGANWTGGGVTSQFMYDYADKPIHVGFKANQVVMPQLDIGLAIRLTHTSGVMYGHIKSAWHSGQVHLNLEDQVGDPFVEGEFVTEIALQDSKFVERAGDTMIGDLKFEGTNKVVTRHVDSGQNSNLELKHNGTTRVFVGGSSVSVNNSLVVKNNAAEDNDYIFRVEGQQAGDGTGDNILYVQKKSSGGDQLRYYGPVTFNKEVTTKEYVDNSTSPFETAIKAAGFQLGSFKYRRGSDDFPSGAIQSNTTTNPMNIYELKIYNTNADGVQFGNEFYEKFITEKMYVHVRDKSECSYVGRIDEIEMIANGIKLTLTPMVPTEVVGTIYYNNRYDVSIGYSRYGVKYPQ